MGSLQLGEIFFEQCVGFFSAEVPGKAHGHPPLPSVGLNPWSIDSHEVALRWNGGRSVSRSCKHRGMLVHITLLIKADGGPRRTVRPRILFWRRIPQNPGRRLTSPSVLIPRIGRYLPKHGQV